MIALSTNSAWTKSRSTSFPFFATDEELLTAIHGALLKEWGRYSLIYFDRKSLDRDRIKVTDQETDISKVTDLKRFGTNLFWLKSSTLSPELDAIAPAAKETLCGMFGLIHFDHGGRCKERTKESSIGIIWQIRNADTGELRVHREYKQLFDRLKRELQKRLVHAVEWHFPDGTTLEDKRTRMSAEVARRFDCGKMKLHLAKPGRLLTGRHE